MIKNVPDLQFIQRQFQDVNIQLTNVMQRLIKTAHPGALNAVQEITLVTQSL